MRGSAWRLYLGAGAIATGVYYLLPPGPRAVLNVVVGASAVAGIAWHRPARRLAWWLIAAAQGRFVAGDALFSINELVLQIEPFPSLALVELLVSLAYPVGDVLLLSLAARLATTPGRRPVAFRLLIANLGATFAADMVFSVLALQGASTAVTDGGYLAAYLLLGAGALHPSLPRLSGTALTPRARLGPGRLLAMGAAALVAPALLTFQRLLGADIQVAAIAGAWTVLFILVMARMAGLVRGLERAKQRVLTNPAAVARLELAQASLSSEVQGLRELMTSLRPPTLDEVGLE